MREKTERHHGAAERTIKDIRRKTLRHYSAEEKIRIVLAGLQGEDSIAKLCRHEGIYLKVLSRLRLILLETIFKMNSGNHAISYEL